MGIGVAQDLLDDAEIHALFQRMSGVGMAQRMDRGPFVHAGLDQGLLEGDLDAGDRHGLLCGCLATPAIPLRSIPAGELGRWARARSGSRRNFAVQYRTM